MLYRKRITADLVLFVGMRRIVVGTYLVATMLISDSGITSYGLNLDSGTVIV